MISSLRNFAKTKFAMLLVFIMIIPFVFWGMGGMFSSGNTNTIVKIDKINISTQEFIDHINKSNIPDNTIRENLDNNIIEELISTLVSTTLLDLEIKKFEIFYSEKSLLKKLKFNKNFLDENEDFDRMKYEKFLLENNQSAAGFEQRLKNRELQKKLFDYIGAGTSVPKFLTKKLYIENNNKLDIEFIDLNNFYKKKEDFTELEIEKFLNENVDQLKIEYLNFDYAIINPKNLIGVNEFNQTFFDKIDEIEIDISNNVDLNEILTKLNLTPINVANYRYSENKNDIGKKIFEARNIEFDIIENEDNFILYKINKIEQRSPDLQDQEIKNEILELVFQKSKFDYNSTLLKKIDEKKFELEDFLKIGKKQIQNLTLNSIRDNKKFEINAVELIYSLPENSFTLINDENNDIYLARVKKIEEPELDTKSEKFKEFITKQNTNNKNSILKSYDILLNNKYNIVLNQKTIERVKNFFQ